MGDSRTDDVELAERARNGDQQAYGRLVERHRHVAFRVAYLVTGSAADAEDATQEAFVKAYLALDRFRPTASFRPWLLRIVSNEARNRRRSSGRRLFYENREAHRALAKSEVSSPESSAESAETRRILLDLVNDLPEKERLVVCLRYFLELTEAETAEAAGVPRGTVKSRLSRGLVRLRTALSELPLDGVDDHE